MSSKAERSEAREKYCNEKLTPILQVMVAEMLKVLPEDPDEYMRVWLDSKIVEEGGIPPTSAPIVLSTPVSCFSAAPENRPSVGTPLELTGEILPEEEATRLSTLTQLIADTPGASRATMYTVRGSVVPVTDQAEVQRLSTLSQIAASSPDAARATVVTVRGTVVPEADLPRLPSLASVVSETPGAAPRGTAVSVRVTVTEEEAKRLSTLSQLISDTPGAARGTVHSSAPMVALRGTVIKDDDLVAPVVEGAAPPPAEGEMVTVLGTIVPEAQIVAENNRLSTLTQLINDNPGGSRGTLLTLRGSVHPTNLTAQEESRMSTLSAIMAETPGAGRGTVVTVRGTLKSKPGEVVTAQVVVPEEEAKRLSSLSQLIAENPGASRATTVTVRGTVVTAAETAKLSTLSAVVLDTPGAARATLASVLGSVRVSASQGEALAPLDDHESERKVSQKRASNAVQSEQLRQVSEMEHAAHEAQQERESNRKSAVSAYESGVKEAEEASAAGRKASSVKVDDDFKTELEKKRSTMGIQEPTEAVA